ncbi:MAG: nucleoside deaminase [Bacteroidales bacterium]|nr:nucleoside deaminase [Bacteroidales bacterium]
MKSQAHETHERMMRRAIALSKYSVANGGGPFGAVVVKDGKVVGEAANRVTLDIDPTAHAEVNAIRQACRALGTHNLAGCDIYCSCEPCPMCLGAIYWAHIGHVFYGNAASDAAHIGFDDDFIYDELRRPSCDRHIPMLRLLPDEAKEAFHLWENKAEKTEY